jgi:hypothetical protein
MIQNKEYSETKKRFFINCLNKTKCREFFVVIDINEIQHLQLVDLFLDKGLVLKCSSERVIQELNSNWMLRDVTPVLYFYTFDLDSILLFLQSKSLI